MIEIAPTAITLALLPAILALVNLFKGFGITGKWSALLAVLFGIAAALAPHYIDSEILGLLKDGLVLGLAAAGLYDVAGAKTNLKTTVFADTVGTVASPMITGSETTTTTTQTPSMPTSNTLTTNPTEVVTSD